jgi:hypothetical protein
MLNDLSLPQQEIAKRIAEQFSIDAERVYFLKPDKPEEPWLPAESLTTIARQSGNFQAIEDRFDQFIPQLNQVVYSATVVDKDDRHFTRGGVATIGEHKELDEHALASGRAVSAALTAAGFNPLRPGSIVELNLKLSGQGQQAVDEAQLRTQDLKTIHLLAVKRGLIKMLPGNVRDAVAYRRMLKAKFDVTSTVNLDATRRASLINFLTNASDTELATFLSEEADEFASLDNAA